VSRSRSVFVCALAVALVALVVRVPANAAPVECGSIEGRIEKGAIALKRDRPYLTTYVDDANRPAMLAILAEADAAIKEAATCYGKYPLTFRASAYEMRMAARFYLHDKNWREDGVTARRAFEDCALTYFAGLSERCRLMMDQLTRVEDHFGLLETEARRPGTTSKD